MHTFAPDTAAADFTTFMTSFTEDVAFGAEDPGTVIDRYYVPDFVQYNDGLRLDRAKLVDHVRPVRKNVRDYRYEVHEAVMNGNHLAVRYTLHAVTRKNRTVRTQVYTFADLSADGRISRIDQITRILPEEQA
ncbi:nuclear transport factor 2 family protein [Rhodococcus daqingensis]|uniref:Nuclear transport factor 2 family protein n=1 Tax=Rhodococcus daqingensis TaxID=2479363 RepID=A0ABW2RTI9_9NOCA